MQRVENEQNARLKFNDGNIRLAEKDLKIRQIYDIVALIISFILVLCSLAATIFLIVKGYNIAGSIFAEGGVAIIIYALLGKRKTIKQ